MSAITPCMGVEFLVECFEADFETGDLTWRYRPRHHFASAKAMATWNGRFAGLPAGAPHKDGYLAVWVTHKGRRHGLLVHRVLWCMRTGNWPMETVDHRDMNRANNRQDNLREATYLQQAANRPAIRNGLKGASFDARTGRYVAQITHNGRNRFLGRFDTEVEAHAAYVAAAVGLHGQFARAV